jgi:hypothetical protein
MKVRVGHAAVVATFIALPLLGIAPAAHSETSETVNAYATWAGRGQIYPTGPNSATFVGAFSGVIFVEKDKELLNGGNMMCPGMIEINLDDGKQQGSGQCTITNEDGDRVFAKWTCSGTFAAGCTGDLKFTGGTGSFEKISGGGPFVARSTIQDTYANDAGNVVGSASGGMIVWKNVRYVLP